MEIEDVLTANKADEMFVENGTTVIISIFNVNEYHHAHLLVSCEHNKDQDIPVRNVCRSHVISLRVMSRAYGFDNSRVTLSVSSGSFLGLVE